MNHIDACEQPRGADFTVNRLPADDQYIHGPQSAARLPTGNVVVVWNSDRLRTATNMVPANPGSVRAGLVEPAGAPVVPCREREGEVTVAAPPGMATRHAVVGTGTALGSPVYVAWSQSPLDGPSRVFVRALNAQLCALSNSTTSTFEVSEDRDATGGVDYGAFRPTLAVNAAGTRAMVAYLVRRPTATGFLIKYRPVAVSMDTDLYGQLLSNPVDNRDAPGLLADVAPLGAPRLVALPTGYAIVWPDRSEGRWLARWRFLDAVGTPGPVQTTELGGVGSERDAPNLALTVDGDQLLLAWDRARSASPLRREVVARRYARDLRPLGPELLASGVDGDHAQPAIASLGGGAVVVSWDDVSRGVALAEVYARVFDRDGAALFTSVDCDRGAFRVSAGPARRRSVSALVRSGDRLVAFYDDASEVAPDTFGLAVRGQHFLLRALAPGLP